MQIRAADDPCGGLSPGGRHPGGRVGCRERGRRRSRPGGQPRQNEGHRGKPWPGHFGTLLRRRAQRRSRGGEGRPDGFLRRSPPAHEGEREDGGSPEGRAEQGMGASERIPAFAPLSFPGAPDARRDRDERWRNGHVSGPAHESGDRGKRRRRLSPDRRGVPEDRGPGGGGGCEPRHAGDARCRGPGADEPPRADQGVHRGRAAGPRQRRQSGSRPHQGNRFSRRGGCGHAPCPEHRGRQLCGEGHDVHVGGQGSRGHSGRQEAHRSDEPLRQRRNKASFNRLRAVLSMS